MVIDIDELNKRLENETETFTNAEVRALLDWHIQHELVNDYQKQRVASVMQQAVVTTELVNASMQQLLALWDTGAARPDLEVVTDDGTE